MGLEGDICLAWWQVQGGGYQETGQLAGTSESQIRVCFEAGHCSDYGLFRNLATEFYTFRGPFAKCRSAFWRDQVGSNLLDCLIRKETDLISFRGLIKLKKENVQRFKPSNRARKCFLLRSLESP